jgi:hypothetical protein
MSIGDLTRRTLITSSTAAITLPLAAAPADKASERDEWVALLRQLADPVIHALAERKLKLRMPVEAPHADPSERALYTHLEAFGRLLAGLAPWLESGQGSEEENRVRATTAEAARSAIAASVDPKSPDFLNFNKGSQPLVDAAFLALAVLRAPQELWQKLDKQTQSNLLAALRSSRDIRPSFSNWLLFSATVEALFCMTGEWWDKMRVDYALRQLNEWYKGDGIYSDGPVLHWDYYNSYVIHPMLLAVSETVAKQSPAWNDLQAEFQTRTTRYAALQARLIAPDGSFPVVGRSITYRCGAFHVLADMALREKLPEPLTASGVRAGLWAVIQRTLKAPGTFDANGWLQIGLCGHQPALGETYISTGSLYLASVAFLPLGLPASNRFWTDAGSDWIGQQIWSGKDVAADHALDALYK